MSSSTSSVVQPAIYGGYGRQTGPYGGLAGVEFAMKCPPDVQRGTRIVAVCGIPEAKASPQKDGWFFSDFFLFYQMLRDRPELPHQLWLSSCSPRDLVAKYTRYVHGPANGIAGDRRVVMDKDLLPPNELGAGFRIVTSDMLLERFLATLKSEVKEAAQTKQPVLVLIFGHGEESNYGISIGCDLGGKFILTKDRLRSALQKDVPTTFILTSCYSGGWVMTPNLNKHFDVKPDFNQTFLTAAGHENESLSWPVSQSIGRQAGGSVFATCLIDSVITFTDGKNKDGTDKLTRMCADEDNEDTRDTMAALTKHIVDSCKERYGSLWTEHKFSFASRDDLWALVYSNRTGLPLTEYKARWESLPEAPISKEVYATTGPLAGSIVSKPEPVLYRIVKERAIKYMSSHPGPDNGGCNTNCHPGFHSLVEGRHVDIDELPELYSILEYRQGLIAEADFYCFVLNIGVPEDKHIDKFDEVEWARPLYIAKDEGSAKEAESATKLLKRFDHINSKIIQLRIFNSPKIGQGYSYSKPRRYLASRLAETSMEIEEIEERLECLVQCILQAAQLRAQSPLGREILKHAEVNTLRGRLARAVGKAAVRLRSISPNKR